MFVGVSEWSINQLLSNLRISRMARFHSMGVAFPETAALMSAENRFRGRRKTDAARECRDGPFQKEPAPSSSWRPRPPARDDSRR